MRGIPTDDERGPPDARARKCARPQHEFDGCPVDADPLGLDTVGNACPIETGPELDAGRHASGEVERPVEGRRIILGSDAGRLGVARSAAGGVEPHGFDPRQVHLLGAIAAYLDGLPERGEVVGGDRGGHFIGIDREHVQPDPRQTQRIAADAAAEVGDARDPRCAESPRMASGDRQPCRLFEAGAGEQHPIGELPELGARFRAQPSLADSGRDEVGRATLGPQTRHGGCDVAGCRQRAEFIDEPEALRGEQCRQLSEIHEASLCAPGCIHRPRVRQILA